MTAARGWSATPKEVERITHLHVVDSALTVDRVEARLTATRPIRSQRTTRDVRAGTAASLSSSRAGGYSGVVSEDELGSYEDEIPPPRDRELACGDLGDLVQG